MLWLALHLPRLPLEAISSGPQPLPRCVIDERTVQVADEAALAAGITRGMSLASALALEPALLPLARDPLRERQLMQGLALSVSTYTPHVVVDGDEVRLNIESSLRLFGGLPAVLRGLRRVVDEWNVQPALGIAPTATGASLLACHAPPRSRQATTATRMHARLDRVPVAAVAPEMQALLQGIGCRTLADVRALPRRGLQRRGGGALLQLLDRAYGDAPDPQTWFEPPRVFAQSLELMQRADDVAMLGHAAQRLVQALAGWLSCQWLAASAFSLWLQHETTGRHARPPTRVRVELGQPSRDADQLGLLLRERLSRCELPAPVYSLELRLDEAVALAGHEAGLPFGNDRSGARWQDPKRDDENLQALLDRLVARLGADQVRCWFPHADHRPDRQTTPGIGPPPTRLRAPPQGGNAGGPAEPDPRRLLGGQEGHHLSVLARPAWLLPEPLQLTVNDDGRLVHGGPLTLRTAAERIEAGWFDGAPVCRDYHVAVGRDHRLRWVYRDQRVDAWFLHGLFG